MSDPLSTNAVDHAAMITRILTSCAPYVGGLLSEILTVAIPGQRLERITDFVRLLDARVCLLEGADLRQRLLQPSCSDLFEEGVRQAARSLTEKRRVYLANLVSKGFTLDSTQDIALRFLLRLLEQLNDAEIVQLAFYIQPDDEAEKAYQEKHAASMHQTFVFPVKREQTETNLQTFYRAYESHLVQLGLLGQQLQTTWDGPVKKEGPEITELGRLLLSYILDGQEPI